MSDEVNWLKEHMRQQMTSTSEQTNHTGNVLLPEDILGKPARTVSDRRKPHTAFDLVCQAAVVIKNLENRAEEIESSATLIIKSAIQKLESAHSRIQSLENERRTEAEQAALKVQNLARALEQAEVRAKAAESRAAQSEETLAQLEDAIRTQLLQRRDRSSKYSEAA